MGQTDLVVGVGLVSGSRFFILLICVAWARSGSTHFPGQYALFIENAFGCMELGQRKRTCPAS